MKKRKTIEEREDEEEQKNKYLINTDLIEGLLKDEYEVQDVSSMRDQAFAQLTKDMKKPAMLPNQAMASISELKRELQKAKTDPLKLSILETLISKCAGQEKLDFLQAKIELLLELNRLTEAETDIKQFLSLRPNSKTRLLYSRLLNRKKEPLLSMIELLRCETNCEEISISELYNSLVFTLSKLSYTHTLTSIGSNINFTLGDGTQDSSQRLKLLPELKGRVALQVSCGEFHTLALVSSCPHIAKQEKCDKDLRTCNGGVDVIVWGENSHGQLLGHPSQSAIKKPIAVEMLIGCQVSMISTNRYLSAAALQSCVRIWGEAQAELQIKANKLACGSRFVVIASENDVFIWGTPNYNSLEVDLGVKTIGNIKVIELAAGMAHVLALDDQRCVWTHGCGDKGELGAGPTVLTEPGLHKLGLSGVDSVMCYGQISVAISSAAVFVWGFVNPEALESAVCKKYIAIEWEPYLLQLSSRVLSAGIGGHEMVVMCEDHKFYIWEWNYNRRFKRQHETHQGAQNTRAIAVGKSMHMLIQGTLIPQLTKIIACPESTASSLPFTITLQLFDQIGPVNHKGPNISAYFTREKEKAQKSALEFLISVRDEKGTFVEITPLGFGRFFIHLLVNDCEIDDLAVINIVPNEDEVENARIAEEIRLKEIEKERERTEKLEKAEMEKKKSAALQEETNKKKKEETEKRAQETLKTHRSKQEKEREDKEKERKQKLELKTGGGYDLSKKKK